MNIPIEISPGELADKITILEIKSERIRDAHKLANVRHELALLETAWTAHVGDRPEVASLVRELKSANEQLWVIEDAIRDEEREKRFGEKFIDLARSVYRTNDERATLKRNISEVLGSAILEEKSYTAY